MKWTEKVGETARAFVWPQRTFEKLVSSVTGVPLIKEYTIKHLPIIGDVPSEQHAIARLKFTDVEQADKVAELLNHSLQNAAEEMHAKHFFQGLVRHHDVPMMDRIVFLRNDNSFFGLGEIYGHLKQVEKFLQKTGRTFAEQIAQQRALKGTIEKML